MFGRSSGQYFQCLPFNQTAMYIDRLLQDFFIHLPARKSETNHPRGISIRVHSFSKRAAERRAFERSCQDPGCGQQIHIVISEVLYLLMWTVRMDACVYDVWMMHGCMYGNLAVSTRTLACVIAFNTRQCASNATASVCTEKATEARHHQARHPAPHSHQNNHKPQPAANQHHQQIKHTSAAPESVSLPNRCQMSPRLAYQFRTHPLKRSAHLLSVCSIMPTHGLV